jgi:hypothetical protein
VEIIEQYGGYSMGIAKTGHRSMGMPSKYTGHSGVSDGLADRSGEEQCGRGNHVWMMLNGWKG